MKILASDFDDTIYLENDLEKTKDNVQRIKKFMQQGNIFIIITGRNYTDLKNFLIKEDIPYSYLVCEDGAKLFNNMDYCFHTILLEEELINRIIPALEEKQLDYYLDDGYNKTENRKDCVKIVINCKIQEEKEKIVSYLKEEFPVHIYASRTHVNIINKAVNKEKALKILFNLEELSLNHLYVIGDNDNDYEMLKAFQGAVISKHHKKLDELEKEEYDTLKDYIEELMKD